MIITGIIAPSIASFLLSWKFQIRAVYLTPVPSPLYGEGSTPCLSPLYEVERGVRFCNLNSSDAHFIGER